jgi:hypothetical protein
MISDRRARPGRPSAGLSMMELVIALALLALVLGGVYRFIVSGGHSARVTNAFLQIQAQVRAALDNVVDELRWGERTITAGPTQVTVLIPQATPFSAGSPYYVTFAYDAATDTLTRQEDPDAAGPLPPGPAAAVAYAMVQKDGSAGVSFEYFGANGNSLGGTPPDPSLVVRIRMALTATMDGTSRTLIGDTALRAR